MESIKNVNEYKDLADDLEKLEIEESQGKGVEFIHWIVTDLRNGNMGAAKVNYRNQSDKYGAYPKVKEFLKQAGIAEDIDWNKLE